VQDETKHIQVQERNFNASKWAFFEPIFSFVCCQLRDFKTAFEDNYGTVHQLAKQLGGDPVEDSIWHALLLPIPANLFK
jgi:hypothetical protein